MNDQATGTLPRADKGPLAAAPILDGDLRIIADAVAGWPGISATAHWHLTDRTRVDGVDFYWEETELGHVHLDGSIHLATSPDLGRVLVAERTATPFRYQRGWVEEQVRRIGPAAAIALSRRNYDDLLKRAAGR